MTESTLKARPYWWPELTDETWVARIRVDYPEESADLDDESIRDEYADGWKYADTWDNLSDARIDYEKLADAFLELVARDMSRAAADALPGDAVLWRAKMNQGGWMYFDYEPTHLEDFESLYAAAPQPGDGWVLVPRVATLEMLTAIERIGKPRFGLVTTAETWSAMIAAAPQPETST